MIILHVYTKNGRLSQVYVALHTMDSSKDGKLHFIDQIYFLIVRVIICYFFKLLLQKAGLQYLFFSCDCSSVRFCNNFVWSTLGEPLSLKCMERFGYEVIEDVKQPYLSIKLKVALMYSKMLKDMLSRIEIIMTHR